MKLFYKYLLNILTLFLLIFQIACSSSSDISQNKIHSQTSVPIPRNIISNNIELTIPSNWTEIKDNKDRIFEIWLVNNEANAVISFIPINFNTDIDLNENLSKINIIKELIITKKKKRDEDFIILHEENISSNYPMKSMKYSIDNQIQNSCIFGNNEKFYECVAYFHQEYKPASKEIDELIETQKKILSEIIIF